MKIDGGMLMHGRWRDKVIEGVCSCALHRNWSSQSSLYDARNSESEDPPIPALPQSVIDDTAALYVSDV